MKLDFEYGHGLMSAQLPDSTDVFIPGQTVADPPYIPEDQLEAAYLESLRHPIGMKPLSELAFPGAKVVALVVENEQAEELMPGVEGIVVLESLKLDKAEPGNYILCALPLKIDTDGSPIRACLLQEWDEG